MSLGKSRRILEAIDTGYIPCRCGGLTPEMRLSRTFDMQEMRWGRQDKRIGAAKCKALSTGIVAHTK
jgi:hypothetical protein